MCGRKICWQNCNDCTLWSQNRGLIHRVHTEWRLPIPGVHPIVMEKSAPAGEGRGVHAGPLSAYYHHVQSCSVLYTPTERADTLPLYHLYPICTMWTDQTKFTKSFIAKYFILLSNSVRGSCSCPFKPLFAGADPLLPAAKGGSPRSQRGAFRRQPSFQPFTQAVWDNPPRLSGRYDMAEDDLEYTL